MLFYTLLFTLAAGPLLTALHFDANLLQVFLAFSLLSALLGVPERGWRTVLMLVAAVAVAVRIAPVATAGVRIEAGVLVVCGALALAGTVSAARFAVSAPVISAERIHAALSAYLLAGLVFGVVHWAVAATWHGSLVESGAAGPPAAIPLSTAIYYSFVTLATLGYGDVVPKARDLAVLEAVAGQLYIAVTIARLVGAQLSRQRRPGERRPPARLAEPPPTARGRVP